MLGIHIGWLLSTIIIYLLVEVDPFLSSLVWFSIAPTLDQTLCLTTRTDPETRIIVDLTLMAEHHQFSIDAKQIFSSTQ